MCCRRNLYSSAVCASHQRSTSEHLQRFLGFTNFHRHFIRDYSRVVAPLTKLTSTKLPYQWSPEVEMALVGSRPCSSPSQFSSIQIRASSSWWRWMLPTLEWGLYCISIHQLTKSYTPAPFSLPGQKEL